MESNDNKKLTEQNKSTEQNNLTELDKWTGTLRPNSKLMVLLDDNNEDKEFHVVLEEQEREITKKMIDKCLMPDELSWALKRDKVVEVEEEKIEIGKLSGTTVVGAKFESDKMNDLLKSMATKEEFKFAIEMVLGDVNVNETQEVVWFSALVKQLNANGITLADGKTNE